MSTENNSARAPTNDEELYYTFHYHPSIALGYVGIAVFGVLSVILMRTAHGLKLSKFMMKVPVLSILECVGFVLRVMAINGKFEQVGIAMSVLLLIAPNLLSLINYNCLIEILKLANIQSEKIYYQPKPASIILTVCTVSCSIIQAIGGGIVADPQMKNAGYALLFVGLALQFIIYVGYIFILSYVHKTPKFDYQFEGAYNPKQKLVHCLYLTTTAFIIRNVYRIIQYALVVINHPITYEWTFYIFDALMIAICFSMFIIIPQFFPRQVDELKSESETHNSDTPLYEHHTFNSPTGFQDAHYNLESQPPSYKYMNTVNKPDASR